MFPCWISSVRYRRHRWSMLIKRVVQFNSFPIELRLQKEINGGSPPSNVHLSPDCTQRNYCRNQCEMGASFAILFSQQLKSAMHSNIVFPPFVHAQASCQEGPIPSRFSHNLRRGTRAWPKGVFCLPHPTPTACLN